MKVARSLLSSVLLAVSPGSFSLMAQSAAPASPTKLGSKVFVWDDLKVVPNATGLRRNVVNLPTATFAKFESHVTTLNPGKSSHPPHKHAREEFIIIKEGTLDVHINGRVQRVGPGSLLFYASNDLHNVTNAGLSPATYLVFNYETVATRTAPAEGAAAANLPGKLPSTVFDWEKLAVKTTRTGARREVMNSPTVTCANLECHITTLNAGEAPHAAHRHPDEEIVVIKEGVMEVTINGVTQRGGPGSIFFFGSNDEHGMKNVGGTTATYHVVRIVTAATPKAATKS
jgi:quercetin dioxygenase-like cupin family protein